MASILDSLQTFFARYGNERTYWLGFSGGLDSQVLLHVCHRLRTKLHLKLHALHINHGVNAQADHWQQHCAEICAQYAIAFSAIHLPAIPLNNFEAQARQARYKVFAKYVARNDILLTAHHLDDQAETVLLQLCRGAGPKGLAAMPMLKPFTRGWHARPLLHFTRRQLELYAQAQGLYWIDDDTNNNPQYTRNFIRHAILPTLSQRWPNITRTLARSAAHCAAQEVLLTQLLTKELMRLQGTKANTIAVSKLALYPVPMQRALLRTWLAMQNVILPSSKKLETILQTFLTAQWDKLPQVNWLYYSLRRYRDDIYLSAPAATSTQSNITWDLRAPLHIADVGTLTSQTKLGQGLKALATVSVRFRQGGEQMHLGARGQRALKKLLQEWQVLPWERDRIPLIFYEDKLIHVVGYATDPAFVASGHEPGVCIEFRRPPSPASGRED